jgi:ATP-binding cassette subfamily F protein uup
MLIRATDIEVSFATHLVLRGANITVSKGECVALIGNNGSGKSTLLRVLAGDLRPDHGTVERHAPAGMLEQNPSLPGDTIRSSLEDAQSWHQTLLDDYQSAIDSGDMDQAGQIQDRLDDVGWELSYQVAAVADRLGAPPLDTPIANLSGGQHRRVALGRALLKTPELLLLDEPTNHLDAEAIEWLQSFLQGYRGAVILVTHDRYLLEAVADRIVEVEDGLTIAYQGSYADYLLARAERRSRQEKTEMSRVATLAREADWASRSPAARSTKQRARLKRLEVLQDERPMLRESSFDLDLRTGFKGGAAMLEFDQLDGGYGDTVLIRSLSTAIQAKSVIGILGPNGVGKTTLFKLISRELEPLGGAIYRAPRVKLAVINQARSGLDDTDTLFDAAGGGNSHVTIGDHSVHVASFLRRFLFRADQHGQRVGALSGGERMRLLLAKLLLSGANVLLLDEPTNDLDLMTLRILEEALIAFDGASLIISHDRALLDRAATAVLNFEPNGKVTRYASRLQAMAATTKAEIPKPSPQKATKPSKPTPSRLSGTERRELEALPAKVEALETERDQLGERLADPALYRAEDGEAADLGAAFKRAEAAVTAAYARWEALEAQA